MGSLTRFTPKVLNPDGPVPAQMRVIRDNFAFMAQGINAAILELSARKASRSGVASMGGSGTPGTLPVWDSATTLADSDILQSGGTIILRPAGVTALSAASTGVTVASLAGFGAAVATVDNAGKLGAVATLPTGNGGTGLSSIGTANQVLGVVNAGGSLEYKSIAGTTNRVTVTHGAGSITLSGPQDIHSGAIPTFAGVYVNGALRLATQAATMDVADDPKIYSVSGTFTAGHVSNFGMFFALRASSASPSRGWIFRRIDDTTNVAAISADGNLWLSGLTASQGLETDANKKLISVAFTGTGNHVRATSPTISGPTFTGSISTPLGNNQVVFSASGVLSGSANFTWSGTVLGITQTGTAAGSAIETVSLAKDSTDTKATAISFYKSRTGGVSVTTGDYLGFISTFGYQGAGYSGAAAIGFKVMGATAGTRPNAGIELFVSKDSAQTVALTLDATTYAGFGIGAPVCRVHIRGSGSFADASLRLERTTDSAAGSIHGIQWINHSGVESAVIHVDNNDGEMKITADGHVGFIAGTSGDGTPQMRLTTAGRLLLGTTTDNGADLLQVEGTARFKTTASWSIALNARSTWNDGGGPYPTIHGTHADEWVMLHNPVIPYLQNGVGGYTGTTVGAKIRFTSASTPGGLWDIGCPAFGVSDNFTIGRNSVTLARVDSAGNMTLAAGLYTGLVARSNTEGRIVFQTNGLDFYKDTTLMLALAPTGYQFSVLGAAAFSVNGNALVYGVGNTQPASGGVTNHQVSLGFTFESTNVPGNLKTGIQWYKTADWTSVGNKSAGVRLYALSGGTEVKVLEMVAGSSSRGVFSNNLAFGTDAYSANVFLSFDNATAARQFCIYIKAGANADAGVYSSSATVTGSGVYAENTASGWAIKTGTGKVEFGAPIQFTGKSGTMDYDEGSQSVTLGQAGLGTASLTVKWVKQGKTVTLFFPYADLTSSANNLTISTLPASIRPTTSQYVPCMVVNAFFTCVGAAFINTSGIIDFEILTAGASDTDSNGFAGSGGGKGVQAQSITYSLY